jgi:precorrin-6A/cobalt-precorrin-6A reductase
MRKRVLILGGTTEASAVARALAQRSDLDVVLSLAGRTETPVRPPIPHRIGGFGGIEGLIDYLKSQSISGVIDATHPFAAQMTQHAAHACDALDLPRLIFTRPAWEQVEGDQWQCVGSVDAAVKALGENPKRVFLTVGRLSLSAFRHAEQHFYFIRSIDQPEAHVTKNSGGAKTDAKLQAARVLQIPVLMIERPTLPESRVTHDLQDALAFVETHGRAP